jgi:hypothetical protein
VQKLLKEWELVDYKDIEALDMIAFPWEVAPDGLHSG